MMFDFVIVFAFVFVIVFCGSSSIGQRWGFRRLEEIYNRAFEKTAGPIRGNRHFLHRSGRVKKQIRPVPVRNSHFHYLLRKRHQLISSLPNKTLLFDSKLEHFFYFSKTYLFVQSSYSTPNQPFTQNLNISHSLLSIMCRIWLI